MNETAESPPELAHKCSECEKMYKSAYALSRHEKTHFGLTKYYNCKFCDKSFPESAKLKQHYLIHTGEKPFVCGICKKRFNDKSNLMKHIKIHYPRVSIPTETLTCSECGNESKSVIALWNHRRKHFESTEIYKCDLCGKEFTETSTFKQHFITHSSRKPFECEICEMWFHKDMELLNHKLFHMSGITSSDHLLKCSKCGKEFKKSSGLWNHMKTHTKQVYTCDVCNKIFLKNSSYKQHYMIHTGEKPFECQSCGHCFNKKSALVKHTKIHNKEKSPPIYAQKCSECGKLFRSDSKFQKHLKTHIHNKDKVHKCDVCGKKFSKISLFEKHCSIHSGKNSLKCQICGRFFNKKSTYIKHTEIHKQHAFPSVSVHKCSECGKKFKSSSRFQKHKKTHLIDEDKVHISDNACSKNGADKQFYKIHSNETSMSQYENCESIEDSEIPNREINEIDISSSVGNEIVLNEENSTKILSDCENTKEFALEKPKFINVVKLIGISTLTQHCMLQTEKNSPIIK